MEKIENHLFTIIKGNSNVIVSAPHTYNHKRNGKIKIKDTGTLEIVELLNKLTNCHVIYTNNEINYDPNYDKNNEYKNELVKYIENNNIKYLIDLHGTKVINTYDIEIGTNYLSNINYDNELLLDVKKIMKENGLNKIVVDKKFKSSQNTICHDINKKTNIKTLQFEISKKYRIVKSQKYKTIINSLCNVVLYLEKRELLEDINYIKKYDELLEIKPSYGYKRDIKPVLYDEVGLEIEVAVNYDRNSYSFIRKMLKKIKDLVGDNGYFVKDGTILGDYSFEIVLDPMGIQEIYTIFSKLKEIIKFSNNTIEISSNKKCGIHFNFNKYDISSLEKAHKKITVFAKENPEYFDENMYKQFKFLWDYNKYIEYQNDIGDKYLWVNYLKTKIVEIRNIKADLNPEDLAYLLTNFLKCLYYDKKKEIELEENYMTIDKLYDIALEKNRNKTIFENIKNDKFIIIGLNDGNASIVEVSEELKSKIKEYIEK